jgi:hypothetical protein
LEAEDESDTEEENRIEGWESPEQRNVSAAPHTPWSLWLTPTLKNMVRQQVMRVKEMDTKMINRNKKKYDRMHHDIVTRFFMVLDQGCQSEEY